MAVRNRRAFTALTLGGHKEVSDVRVGGRNCQYPTTKYQLRIFYRREMQRTDVLSQLD